MAKRAIVGGDRVSMQGVAAAQQGSWEYYEQRILRSSTSPTLPDALVISPAKTGTTWLHRMLSQHPAFSLPDYKEIRFFDQEWRNHDVQWYGAQFPDPHGRIRVDISPSYALLPRLAIRVVRALLPSVKLVFLLRDPVDQAWSHAKHLYRHRLRAYQSVQRGDAPIMSEWLSGFIDDWPLQTGSYAASLSRWADYFPREQFYIGFYERIAAEPKALLDEIVTFLGGRGAPWSEETLRERVLAGLSGSPTPTQERFLRFVVRRRALQSIAVLQERFDITVPASAWARTLQSPSHDGPYPVQVRYHDRTIAYDGDVFCAGDMVSSIQEELKARLAGEENATEDMVLQRILDSVPASTTLG